ncbi:MAG: TRAP transporter substrate-binding protein [Dethiobacter sp.]|jgi:TRAP-type C4-dicarboxylate transport system substrate-binding protein|nr:MAG: TRAP transporter substrate-binding protein [Dethiobacter sp.]
MFFKKMFFLACIFLLTFTMVSCAPAGNTDTIADERETVEGEIVDKLEKTITLSFTGGLPVGSPVTDLQYNFADKVKALTDGRVEIETYVGGELFDTVAGVDAVVTGAADLATCSEGHFAGYSPFFGFTEFFWMVRDFEHWDRVRDDVNPILSSIFENHGVKLLATYLGGECSIGANKPIRSLEDIKGLKIRGATGPIAKGLELLGASPVNLAPGEVYDALARNALDGVATLSASMYTRKFYEVVDYFIAPVWNPVWVVVMNIDTWNSLPEDIQELILEAGEKAEEESRQALKNYDEEAWDIIADNGKEIYFLSSEEIPIWSEQVEPIYNNWVENCKGVGYENEAKEILNILNR